MPLLLEDAAGFRMLEFPLAGRLPEQAITLHEPLGEEGVVPLLACPVLSAAENMREVQVGPGAYLKRSFP